MSRFCYIGIYVLSLQIPVPCLLVLHLKFTYLQMRRMSLTKCVVTRFAQFRRVCTCPVRSWYTRYHRGRSATDGIQDWGIPALFIWPLFIYWTNKPLQFLHLIFSLALFLENSCQQTYNFQVLQEGDQDRVSNRKKKMCSDMIIYMYCM